MYSPSKRTDLTVREFCSLSLSSQLEYLRRVDAGQKALLLLEMENGAELMACLPVQEAYLMFKTLGPDQVPELIALASPDQWQGFIDFECWTKDRTDPGRVRYWLTLLLEGDDEQVMANLQLISFELLILLVKKEVQVLAGPETIEDEDALAEAMQRDMGYQLAYRDEEGAKLFGSLLNRLFGAAPDFCRYLIEAVRAETESLIEESVYQQRGGRLLDLGFADPFEAQVVYAWLAPETFELPSRGKFTLGRVDEEPAPGFMLTMTRPTGLLGEILDAGVDEETGWELACLINKVAMADRIDIGDIDQVQYVIRKTCGLVNLSLEFLAGTDVTAAEQVFRDVYCEQLFRLGFSLTLKLQRRARALTQSTVGPYLDGRFRALLAPLREPCPRFYEGLEQEGLEDSRLFSGLRDIRLCEEWLDLLEIQRRLFENHFDFILPPPDEFDLEGTALETAEFLTLSEIFLTALANRLLGRPFRPEPIAATELVILHRKICSAGTLRPELVMETAEWLESLEEGAGGFAEFCLDVWQDEFCSIQPDAMDPRYIGGSLIVKPAARTDDSEKPF